MAPHQESKTETQKWVARRVDAVRSVFSAYEVLTTNGVELPDESTDYQISCHWHGPDKNPSARYYAKSGRGYDHFYCFRCKLRLDSINLHAKFRGLRFMDALTELERRFRIKIPRRPESPEIAEPSERNSEYVSDKWNDVPRVLMILEKKLLGVRDHCSMSDYIKFCRLIDAIRYDYDLTQIATPEMVSVLIRARSMIDDIAALPDDLNSMEIDDNSSS